MQCGSGSAKTSTDKDKRTITGSGDANAGLRGDRASKTDEVIVCIVSGIFLDGIGTGSGTCIVTYVRRQQYRAQYRPIGPRAIQVVASSISVFRGLNS